jgi:hypothetical protein
VENPLQVLYSTQYDFPSQKRQNTPALDFAAALRFFNFNIIAFPLTMEGQASRWSPCFLAARTYS